MFVLYISVHCLTPEPILGIFAASIGLFVASSWYTLTAAGELMTYAGYLDILRTITIEVNLTDITAGISSGRGSSTLQSGRHVAWSDEDNRISRLQIIERPVPPMIMPICP